MKPDNPKIYEDIEYTINAPYNLSKEIFNTDKFYVRIIKESGEKPLVIVRRKPELEK